ncbi:hypothetical protein [Paenibacillus selenitireducens]|nr:hypothetical protein [Paenibacillus selenitireducens]
MRRIRKKNFIPTNLDTEINLEILSQGIDELRYMLQNINVNYSDVETEYRISHQFEEQISESIVLSNGIAVDSNYKIETYTAYSHSFIKQDEYSIFKFISAERLAELLYKDHNGYYGVIGHWGGIISGLFPEVLRRNLTWIQPSSFLENGALNNDNEPGVYKKCHPAIIADELNKVDHLLISNIHLSNLYLLSPNMLEELAHNVKEMLYLPVRMPTRLLSIVWGHGFSSYQYDGQSYFRWAIGTQSKFNLELINSTSQSIKVQLSWESETSSVESSILRVSGLGLFVNVPVSNNISSLSAEVTLLPGKNNLQFEYLGIPVQGNDLNLYQFMIKNLILSINNQPYLLNEEAHVIDHIEDYYLDDYSIRQKLHSSGFFEVKPIAFINSGYFSVPLPTSRYLHRDSFVQLKDGCSEEFYNLANQGIYSAVVLYCANRSTRLEDEVSTDV